MMMMMMIYKRRSTETRWVSKLNESNWTVNPHEYTLHIIIITTQYNGMFWASSLSALTALSIAETINNVANCFFFTYTIMYSVCMHGMTHTTSNEKKDEKKIYWTKHKKYALKNMYYHAYTIYFFFAHWMCVWDMVRTMRSLVSITFFCSFDTSLPSFCRNDMRNKLARLSFENANEYDYSMIRSSFPFYL